MNNINYFKKVIKLDLSDIPAQLQLATVDKKYLNLFFFLFLINYIGNLWVC